MTIEVFPYDPQWKRDFEEEEALIRKALAGQNLAIHHVGSTSVPGMMAKPIIDVLLVAEDRDATIGALTEQGYSFRGEWNIPLQCGFNKRNAREGAPNANLHAFFGPHPEVELNLTYRDYLRSHPHARERYSRTKQEILKDPSAQLCEGKLGLPNYTKMKRAVIDGLLKEAGFNRPRILKCLTEEERTLAQKWQGEIYGAYAVPKDNFDSREDEHLLLYKGVDPVGYAHVRFDRQQRIATLGAFALTALTTLTALTEEDASFLKSMIQTWVQVHQYSFRMGEHVQ